MLLRAMQRGSLAAASSVAAFHPDSAITWRSFPAGVLDAAAEEIEH
jgi:hypothetical protein